MMRRAVAPTRTRGASTVNASVVAAAPTAQPISSGIAPCPWSITAWRSSVVAVSCDRRSTTSTAAAAQGSAAASVAASRSRAGEATASTTSPAAAAISAPRLNVRYSVTSVTTNDADAPTRTAVGSRAAARPPPSSAAIAANAPRPFQ